MAKTWTQEEDNYLLGNLKYDPEFLSNVLQRSPSAVADRIKKLNRSQIQIQPELEFFMSRSTSETAKNVRQIKGTVVNSASLRSFRPPRVKKNGSAWQFSNSGYRPDIGINARSNWESNFARVLNLYNIQWEFEPRVFTYPIKRGTKGYTPDFYLNVTEEWVELKGFLDSKSQIKLKRFKKYYPDEFERMTMIISRSSKIAREFCANLGVPTVIYYEEIGNLFRDKIPAWEGK